MRFLRDIPIRHKLTLIVMSTTCLALLLACTGFVAFAQFSYRGKLVNRLTAVAGTIGDNSTSALSFGDPESAAMALRSLSHQKFILGAAIYDADGDMFARYQRTPAIEVSLPERAERNIYRFSRSRADLFRDIQLDGETIGSIYLLHDMSELRQLQFNYAMIAVAVLVSASLISLGVTSRLQRVISVPVASLAEVAAQVSKKKDYSLRASKQSEDELGQLIDGFNDMLAQIQIRDEALGEAQEELEMRVASRTQELASSFALLTATFDSTADGVLSLRFKDRVVLYNSQYLEMWGVPHDLMDSGDAEAITAHFRDQVKDPILFDQRIEVLYATHGEETFDVLELKDGRVFERYVKPQLVDGEAVGMVLNFRDVTERRQAEAELGKVHRQLLETSRQAGMSEVATNVIHNVGNVLNSVNISCSTVADLVLHSRISSVAKAATLLKRHEDNLVDFFGMDPAGQKLPGFLGKLSDRLHDEQAAILEELHSLHENICHIKDIVAVQQNYAKNLSGIREQLAVVDVVEDALRMSSMALRRHHVIVNRDFQDFPVISLEKSKVLQILVNLIQNAQQAMDQNEVTNRQLSVTVSQNGEQVSIGIRDNGMGIAQENLSRIFAHGFTTRAEGHGFGLHSGVLTARDMGGRLAVESEGLGQGATFILELPVAIDQIN